MTLRTRLKTAAAMALALFVAGPAAALPRAAPPSVPSVIQAVPAAQGRGPALWVVRDADSTLYLFGTMHLLRPTTAWGSRRVDAAFDSASRLVMEVADPDDQAAVMPLIQQYGMSPDRPLSSLLTADEMTTLDAAARTIGADPAQMEPMRPWLAGIMLSGAPMVRAGLDPQAGAERILRARAAAAGMPVTGFETPDAQIRMFASFPEAGQLAFLRRTLKEFGTPTDEADRVAEAWAAGDLATIAALGIDPMRRDSDLLYQTLLVRRNLNWADQIQTMLEGSGTVFIAVGVLHLIGDDSVQAILKSRGVDVEVTP